MLILLLSLVSVLQGMMDIEPDFALRHVGEQVMVCGRVASAQYVKTNNGSPTFLNVGEESKPQLTVVIDGTDRAKFGQPENKYRGRNICVTGKISELNGKAQMVVNDTKQIKWENLSDDLGLVLAADGAGGFDSGSPRQASVFGGVKIGGPVALNGKYPPAGIFRTFTLDLGYERIQARNGFSSELSIMLPVAMVPRPRTFTATYARIYLEPGAGYRAGGGDLGGYGSAKAMVALFSDSRLIREGEPPSFFLEVQRRLPFTAPLHGDTRFVFGVMFAICSHCGLQ
jgi:hypothetical protein